MILDVTQLIPRKGTMHARLWENSSINLPLHLSYSIEIPFEPFAVTDEWGEQLLEPVLIIDWIHFRRNGQLQERNWRQLVNNQYELKYADGTAQGSLVYQGALYWDLDTVIAFGNRQGAWLDAELRLKVDFDMETRHLPADGLITFSTTLEYEGLELYEPGKELPSFEPTADPFTFVQSFIDTSAYQPSFEPYKQGNAQRTRLRPA